MKFNNIGQKTMPNFKTNLNNYAFDLVHTEEGFAALETDWQRLYDQIIPRNPFFSYDWTKALWRHLCPTAPLFLLIVRSESRLVGVAPLRLEKRWGFRVLRFIGDERSDYLGFMVAPDHAGIENLMLDYLY